MNFSVLSNKLDPFKNLITTIPAPQVQGKKVAHILFMKIEEMANDMAQMSERNAYLERELFGTKKSKKDPDTNTESIIENNHSSVFLSKMEI